MQEMLVALISLVSASVVGRRYLTQRRPAGAVGWALVIVAIAAFGTGVAGAFAWAGLLFVSIGGIGLIVVLQDVTLSRMRRRTLDRKPWSPAYSAMEGSGGNHVAREVDQQGGS